MSNNATKYDKAQREFAVEVVRALRDAKFDAYWAGGCVRDQALGCTPKDYDVATSAHPEQIRELFGHRRTLPIGAAFGVITVLGRKPASPIEVATFRRDGGYSDGRHPDSVSFSSAEEDAQRRDFTINGMFFDPIGDRVIDYVDGQRDLTAGVIRAIGEPRRRFEEDKLRMLRAVRFAATLGFELEPATAAAIASMAPGISAVSVERVTAELRRTLVSPGRARAVHRLFDLGLAAVIWPEIVPQSSEEHQTLAEALHVLDRIPQPSFALALAVLASSRSLSEQASSSEQANSSEQVSALARRWKLTNKEIDELAWLISHRHSLRKSGAQPWSRLQPLLINPWRHDLIAWHGAIDIASADDAEFCREKLQMPIELLDPPPLVSGDDLQAAGLMPGKQFRPILQAIRDAQLDGTIQTAVDAISLARRLAAATQGPA